jgi:HEAT repeats
MIKRLRRILIGTVIGLVLLAGTIWALTRLLNEEIPRYQGRFLSDWLEQAHSRDAALSNQACLVLTATIIPQLTQTMFYDTKDSRLRLALIDQLNDLPGVQIYSTTAPVRRAAAAEWLGSIGPLAQPAIPDLIKALKGKDPAPRPNAARALGDIHSQPEQIIPFLITLLDDPQDDVPDGAALALGAFGSLSKAAVPKLQELLKVPDKDLRAAAGRALKQIAEAEGHKAGTGPETPQQK